MSAARSTDVPRRVKEGELWALGDHRLLCGDATRADNVARLMAGERAPLCFTSPPYSQQREYDRPQQPWEALMCGAFAHLPLTDDGKVLVNLGMVHRHGEWVPYWDGWLEWMRGHDWKRFGLYVWDQGPGMPGDWSGRYAPAHELVFHLCRAARRPNKTKDCVHAGHINRGTGQRKANGVIGAYSHIGRAVQPKKIPDSVIRVTRHKGRGIERNHPAVFPVHLPAEFIEAWTAPGEVCYEPFSGSGSQLLAAERLGRRCYGLELSPRYCDVAIARWEQVSGKLAHRLGRRRRGERA